MGQRDDPLESGRGLAGDQASRPARPLANRPHGRYRLSCPVEFSYRGDEVAAQAATGAIRYDISHDPARDRWYLDASWKAAPVPAPSLDDLRQAPVLAVDVNHGHLAVAAVAPDGNILGTPATIGLDLAGRPATTRDGRLRAAVTTLIATARGARCPRRRDRGPRLRRRPRRGTRATRQPPLARQPRQGLPAAGLRHPHRQVPGPAGPDGRQRGLPVIVVDPAYTSRWGAEHWLRPLREHHPKATGHHAAALVTGRRGLGHRARRRAAGNRTAPEEAARPAPARPRTSPAARSAQRKRAAPRDPRQPPGARPAGLTGPRQATRQPRTVRAARGARTMSC